MSIPLKVVPKNKKNQNSSFHILQDFLICLTPQGFLINEVKKSNNGAGEKITLLTLFQQEKI